MRRVDVDNDEGNTEGDGKTEQEGSGEGAKEERRVFETSSGEGREDGRSGEDELVL